MNRRLQILLLGLLAVIVWIVMSGNDSDDGSMSVAGRNQSSGEIQGALDVVGEEQAASGSSLMTLVSRNPNDWRTTSSDPFSLLAVSPAGASASPGSALGTNTKTESDHSSGQAKSFDEQPRVIGQIQEASNKHFFIQAQDQFWMLRLGQAFKTPDYQRYVLLRSTPEHLIVRRSDGQKLELALPDTSSPEQITWSLARHSSLTRIQP